LYYAATIAVCTLTIEHDPEDRNRFHATLLEYFGGFTWNSEFLGDATVESDGITSFHMKESHSSNEVHASLRGKLDEEEESIRGEYGQSNYTELDKFVFKRSQESMRFYPEPAIIQANPARARWRFALDAIMYRVRRDLRSTSFFMDRSRNRKRYMELAIRKFRLGKTLDSELNNELRMLSTTLTAADARFYTSLIDEKVQTTNIHLYV
jgi:Vacuolar sorting-associated protein 13, N-terminal